MTDAQRIRLICILLIVLVGIVACVAFAAIASAQRAWIEMLRRYGYSAVVVYGAQAAQQAIMAYLGQEGA